MSHLTSCTPHKSNSYLANSLAAAVIEPALHRLLTFQVPNLMSLFHYLGHTKESVQAQGKCSCHVTKPAFMVRSCQHLTQPPSQRTTPCQLSVTAYSIYSQLPLPYWRPPLQPQPEHAPCCGDNDSAHTKAPPLLLACYGNRLTALSL